METDTPEMTRGAEATIAHGTFLGRRALIKTRPPKAYRHPELDSKIRSSRTRNEARIVHEARRAGVRTPCIYDIDLKECSITMEYLDGRSVKDILDSEPSSASDICGMIGETVAKLHSADICHGDLTTSNMILCDGELCLIDFSMGCTKAGLEDKGVDIRLLERAFTSAHTELTDAFGTMMDSYYANISEPDRMRRKVEDIRNRGRYT